jgi:hypothetical protein
MVGGVANAGTIDFESTALGTYTSLTFNGDATLTFTGGNGKFEIQSQSPGAPIFGHTAISYFTNPGSSPFRLTFVGAVSNVKVGVGDYNADVDNTYMRAYDAANVLIGSDYYQNPASKYGGDFLEISAANIKYVEFWDAEPFAGAVYWDSISYTTAQVPEPETLALFGLGLLGLVGMRRRISA